MNQKTLKQAIVLISVTVLLILSTQVYRTIQNYQINKERFVNDIQLALDLSVEKYYADKARDDIFVMTMGDSDTISVNAFSQYSIKTESKVLDSLLDFARKKNVDSSNEKGFLYSWSSSTSQNLSADSSTNHATSIDTIFGQNSTIAKIKVMSTDSITTSSIQSTGLQHLTQRVMISLSEDLIELGRLSGILQEELIRRNMEMDFHLLHSGRDGTTSIGQRNEDMQLSTLAKSTYLPRDEKLEVFFENATLHILKKGIVDLLISFAIVLSVIGALLYLYRIISNQKQLAIIKDDLISNITHEFKTPIATITSAIEGIAFFNEENDRAKTKRYLEMSGDQLKKLNLMVEKLLETASLDSGEIDLDTTWTNLSELTQQVVDNHQVLMDHKALTLELPSSTCEYEVDPFHMENALSNLIDNANKYGGSQITVQLKEEAGRPIWTVADSGGAIAKQHRALIFEKLYRIPTGNQHDVKGFGIGLYYTKSIVEKHGGTVSLAVKPNSTCFTLKL